MKRWIVMLLTVFFTNLLVGQSGNGNGQGKYNKVDKMDKKEKKSKENKKVKDDDDDAEIATPSVKKNKESKKGKAEGIDRDLKAQKVPAKVREQFALDFPNATDVRWTKRRGDFSAFFNGYSEKLARYHANGQRFE
jgi:Rieske Fe-S protein